MDFETKLAQTRLYATENQLGVDSQEVYNEGILQKLEDIVNNTDATQQALNVLVSMLRGIEPSLLSAGIVGLQMNEGVQIGAGFTASGYLNVEGLVAIRGNTDNTIIGNLGDSLLIGIKGSISEEVADVNAANQLKITAV
jgi:hypothetical protein